MTELHGFVVYSFSNSWALLRLLLMFLFLSGVVLILISVAYLQYVLFLGNRYFEVDDPLSVEVLGSQSQFLLSGHLHRHGSD